MNFLLRVYIYLLCFSAHVVVMSTACGEVKKFEEVTVSDVAKLVADPKTSKQKLISTLKGFDKDTLNKYRSKKYQRPLLSMAVISGNKDAVDILIKKGVDVNVRDDGTLKDTPLHYAVRAQNREAADLLLKNKADPMIKNKAGHSPLDVAAKFNPIQTAKYFYLKKVVNIQQDRDFLATKVDLDKFEKASGRKYKYDSDMINELRNLDPIEFQRYLKENVKDELLKEAKKASASIGTKQNEILKSLVENAAKQKKEDSNETSNVMKRAITRAVTNKNIQGFETIVKKSNVELYDDKQEIDFVEEMKEKLAEQEERKIDKDTRVVALEAEDLRVSRRMQELMEEMRNKELERKRIEREAELKKQKELMKKSGEQQDNIKDKEADDAKMGTLKKIQKLF